MRSRFTPSFYQTFAVSCMGFVPFKVTITEFDFLVFSCFFFFFFFFFFFLRTIQPGRLICRRLLHLPESSQRHIDHSLHEVLGQVQFRHQGPHQPEIPLISKVLRHVGGASPRERSAVGLVYFGESWCLALYGEATPPHNKFL